MSLSLASSIAQSSLASTAAQTAIVSRNIDGTNNPNYSRKIANLTTSSTGGGELVSVTRAASQALFDNMLVAQSGAASEAAVASGLNKLDQTVGDPANGKSIAALIGSFGNALQTYGASPNDTTVAQTAVAAASALSNALNTATTTVQGVRSQADADIATSVQKINSLLSQFQSLNATIVNGTASGADVTDAQDSRDAILSQLSQQVGIATTTGPNGGMSIYTDSGVTLFQGTARSVTFQVTGTYSAGTTGNSVFVDGVPITGSTSPMPIQSGTLAGLANLRDNVAVTYQNQLDETARGLIDAFAETDQTGASTTPLPGLFTTAGATSLPAAGLNQGLAGQIIVNPSVDPSQGGNVNLLRDGAISGNANYSYNTNPPNASFTGRIQQLISAISAPQTFSSATGLNTNSNLTSFSAASVSWVEAARQKATNNSTYQNTLVSNSSTALSNATGVNLDTEMSKMLDLEHSYDASSKLISTISSMFTSLFNAMT
jgi:flagellar hook-associated protein 1 FlgK